METLLNKHFWIVKTLGLAIIAGLAASAVMTMIGTSFAMEISDADADESDSDGEDEEDEDEDEPKAKSSLKFPLAKSNSSASLTATKTKVATDIKKRNIFCPACVPEDATPEGETPPSLDDIGQPNGIQPGEVKSTLPLRLTATMEATDPEYSLATIYDGDNAVTGLYGRGDSVRERVVVVGVDAGLVHLRNGAQLEYIQLGDEAAKTAKKPTKDKDPKDKEKPKKPSPYSIEGADDAIKCPTENTCTVERSFVESLMSNPAALAKQARIVPSQKDGETQGFKFYGIRRGSLPKLLGLKNGDMLTEVNGEEVKSVDQAMALAMKLRRAQNLSVTLVRKGKPVTKEITIQ